MKKGPGALQRKRREDRMAKAELQKTVLLYTEAAQIDADQIAVLIANGYVPIKVADRDAVSILPTPLPVATIDMLSRAAIEVCSEQTGGAAYGQKVLKFLLAAANR